MRRIIWTTLIFMVPAFALAQGSGRAKSWDFSVGGIYQQGSSAGGDGGSSLEVDSAFGIGFNVGYNLTDMFNINADFDFLRPDYEAVLVEDTPQMNTQTIRHEMSQFNGRLKATLNLMQGPFVPYVEIGYGWTYLDSNVADGPPTTGCWWHPWWGYICSNFFNTISGTETSYGGGLGFRYEIPGGAFVKLSYNLWKLQVGGDAAEPDMESVRLEYGWRF